MGLSAGMECVHINTLWKFEVTRETLFCISKTLQEVCELDQHLLNPKFLPYLLQSLHTRTSNSEGCGYGIKTPSSLFLSFASGYWASLRSVQLNRVLCSVTFFLSYCKQSSKSNKFLAFAHLGSYNFFCFHSAGQCSSTRDAKLSRPQAGCSERLSPRDGQAVGVWVQRLLQKREAVPKPCTYPRPGCGWVCYHSFAGVLDIAYLNKPNKCDENRRGWGGSIF